MAISGLVTSLVSLTILFLDVRASIDGILNLEFEASVTAEQIHEVSKKQKDLFDIYDNSLKSEEDKTVLNDEMAAISQELEIIDNNIVSSRRSLLKHTNLLNYLIWLVLLSFGIIGLKISTLGFKLWHDRVQTHLDEILLLQLKNMKLEDNKKSEDRLAP